MTNDPYNQVTGLIIQNQDLAREHAKRQQANRNLSHSKLHSCDYVQWLRSRAITAQQAAARAYERIAFLRDL